MDRAAIRRTDYPAMGGINKSLKAKPRSSGTGRLRPTTVVEPKRKEEEQKIKTHIHTLYA